MDKNQIEQAAKNRAVYKFREGMDIFEFVECLTNFAVDQTATLEQAVKDLEAENEKLRGTLRLIAECEGKTLLHYLDSDWQKPYSEGANAAFEQVAALAKIEP